MSKFIDETGRKFGRLTAVFRAVNSERGRARFTCICECGRSVVVLATHLRRGLVKSCGCLQREDPSTRFRTHGMRRSPEYRIWTHMKTRCYNPESKFFYRYGGRGIAICDEWLNDFAAFYRDMGPRPSSDHSIERLRNNEGYKKDNCIWATQDVQAANRESNRYVEFDGRRDTLAGWARATGMPYSAVLRRFNDGWAPERALTEPVRRRPRVTEVTLVEIDAAIYGAAAVRAALPAA